MLTPDTRLTRNFTIKKEKVIADKTSFERQTWSQKRILHRFLSTEPESLECSALVPLCMEFGTKHSRCCKILKVHRKFYTYPLKFLNAVCIIDQKWLVNHAKGFPTAVPYWTVFCIVPHLEIPKVEVVINSPRFFLNSEFASDFGSSKGQCLDR